MSETVITVQGSSSIKHAPERATIGIAVSHDGPDRDTVFAETTKVSEAITTALRGLHEAPSGPVTAWSSEQVSVWSNRPQNDAGAQLPLVFHAAISIEATFSDFDALARWVETAATSSGVVVGSIQWELLEATRDQLLDEMRTHAVRDAAAKALVYAQAAGLTSVTAIAIADPGLLGLPGGAPTTAGMSWMSAKAMSDGAPLAFTPQEIEVTAQVDARFSAL